MKEILKEIKYCRERNLILFAELKSKLDIDEEDFLKDIEEVDQLEVKEEGGKKILQVDGKDLEVYSMIEDEGTYYVSVETEAKFDNEKAYNLFYSKNLN